MKFDFLNLKFIIGAFLLGFVLFLALFGNLITPFTANKQSLMDSLLPPLSGGHILGTDHLGRDILARMISGARVSLAIAASVVVISGVVGVIVGALSGYLRGTWDLVTQKIVESFWAFPPILLAIAILAFFGQSLTNVILALTIQRWIPYSRMSRAQAMVLRSLAYVESSRVMGGGLAWVMRRHILPNLMASAIIVGTFSMATAILAEASLSFLGLGVPPQIATWGGMLAEGRSYITRAWWLAVMPGVGIFITVLSLNLLGDWLRDQYDPKKTLNLI
ncbi:ABC transporter permease [Arenibacterium halophilum]|jgi:peptide/nickel transport system permease protein|uniref:ABC transporter permease n=1 Tax=Arenibacterium halophilum TaxID=2583821 RepID=A0ABY2X2A2_9RHOB|nr:ABC transporter permease [Arenibacterium halophilum]MAY88294.1 peptide ABC transporter permease [Pseudooceanicola sp.]TMV09368.1 ABC transporter permease [Arenibacterium halophilum]|tara:strand:- start:921 stop:1751 length:831 start_codon:yes stop_codon:yes gene_type:complete